MFNVVAALAGNNAYGAPETEQRTSILPSPRISTQFGVAQKRTLRNNASKFLSRLISLVASSNPRWAYGASYSIMDIKLFQGPLSTLRISLISASSSTHRNSMGAKTLFPAFLCSKMRCTIIAPPNAGHMSTWVVSTFYPRWAKPLCLEVGPHWRRSQPPRELAELPSIHSPWSLI